MGQWVKVLADKPDDLSSIPGPYMVERECCPLGFTYIQWHTHPHIYTCDRVFTTLAILIV